MTLAFISGALMLGLLVVGVVFLRYWKDTGQRLFAFFSVAFLLMAFERVMLELTDPLGETRGLVFLLRLAAFILIIIGIIDKNRTRRFES